MTRIGRVGIVLVLLLTLVAGVAAPAVAQEDGNATTTPTPTPQPTATPEDGLQTTPENRTVDDGRPSTANGVRVLPVQFDSQFLDTRTATQNEVYNTSGPMAMFSLSTPVEQVAIRQDGARASVLEGGQTVKIEYAADAAPVGGQSLYTLELFFADGSTKEIELYAEQTSVDVGAVELKKYRPFILDALNDAEAAGYERSTDGLEAHYQDIKADAELLNSLFTEEAKKLVSGLVALAMNRLTWVIVPILVAIGTLLYIRRHGWSLEMLSNNPGKAEQLKERLWQASLKRKQTAADEYLSDVPGISKSRQLMYEDAYGIDSVWDMAEMFREGVAIKKNGEVRRVGGVENIDAENPYESWLEPALREGRIQSPQIVLSDAKKVLHRMCQEYGMAQHYGEPHRHVRELIDELDESQDMGRFLMTDIEVDSGGLGTAGASGGDD